MKSLSCLRKGKTAPAEVLDKEGTYKSSIIFSEILFFQNFFVTSVNTREKGTTKKLKDYPHFRNISGGLEGGKEVVRVKQIWW